MPVKNKQEKIACQYCGEQFLPQGLGSHIRQKHPEVLSESSEHYRRQQIARQPQDRQNHQVIIDIEPEKDGLASFVGLLYAFYDLFSFCSMEFALIFSVSVFFWSSIEFFFASLLIMRLQGVLPTNFQHAMERVFLQIFELQSDNYFTCLDYQGNQNERPFYVANRDPMWHQGLQQYCKGKGLLDEQSPVYKDCISWAHHNLTLLACYQRKSIYNQLNDQLKCYEGDTTCIDHVILDSNSSTQASDGERL